MDYGQRPYDTGHVFFPEIFGINLLYMPIQMPHTGMLLPEGLEILEPIIYRVSRIESFGILNKYVYLSYESSYVKAGTTQKRPGYHTDGFLTNDINYLWHSNTPTIFNESKFKIKKNHRIAMEQFEKQAKEKHEFQMPNRHLLRLDQFVVHKTAIAKVDGIRTFIKVSISNDKYNLKGNTHNPRFNYDWKMYDRQLVRNHPQIKECDSVPYGILK